VKPVSEILLAEDDETDVYLLRRALADVGLAHPRSKRSPHVSRRSFCSI
jgi:hypothetical protein